MLTKQQSETDSGDLTLEFRKARLRTPKNAALFKPQVIRRDEDGWISGGAAKTGKPKNAAARKQASFRQIYFELAITVPATPGHTNAPVRKVALDAIRRGMVARGFLAKEEGKVTDAERKAFQRAKEELIASGKFTATDLHFWEVPA